MFSPEIPVWISLVIAVWIALEISQGISQEIHPKMLLEFTWGFLREFF